MKRILLVGAGHAHVNVVREFGRSPYPDTELTLLSADDRTPYSGMMPGHVAGHYAEPDIHIDAAGLARAAGARFHRGMACAIDLAGSTVHSADGASHRYDVLSLDVGSSPNTANVPGADQHAVPVKPIGRFLSAFEALRQQTSTMAGPGTIAVVGAGPGGVELILAVQHRLLRDMRAAGVDRPQTAFVLVSSSNDILPGMPEKVRRFFRERFADRGIAVFVGRKVTRVEASRLHFEDGEVVEADLVLWVTEAAAPSWLATSGLALDDKGFVRVDACLRAIGHPTIFAAGDVASFDPRAIPKSGVYAVRAGEQLARNLRRVAAGLEPEPFEPQHEALYLITTGGKHAIGTRNGFTFSGRWAWHLKDIIDRRFMARFRLGPA